MNMVGKGIGFLLVFLLVTFSSATGQNTQIRGFIDGLSSCEKGKLSFGFGEQDLFITSEMHDRVTFLGESVFKYTPTSPTEFSVSIERVVIKYNIAGNNNLLVGKHHTPINYWNDTYHHGRVFFPTIERPSLFAANIIPLHTTGISFSGHDLGKARFGYDLMLGNGLGSAEISDNDKHKSLTAAIHVKPVENFRIGISYYHDIVSKGATVRGKLINWKVNQNLFSGSISYFGKTAELLAESTLAHNKTDTTGLKKTWASYAYLGFRVTEKLTPYLRFDNIRYQQGEILFTKDNMHSIVTGIRYQINFLAVVKLEFQHLETQFKGITNKVTAQFAIGF